MQLKAITEALFSQQVIDLAHVYGWRAAHFRPAMTTKGWRTPVAGDGTGFPDLVLAREKTPERPGRVIFAELKSSAGNLSPSQTTWLNVLWAAGAEAYVWWPADFDGIVRVLGD